MLNVYICEYYDINIISINVLLCGYSFFTVYTIVIGIKDFRATQHSVFEDCGGNTSIAKY